MCVFYAIAFIILIVCVCMEYMWRAENSYGNRVCAAAVWVCGLTSDCQAWQQVHLATGPFEHKLTCIVSFLLKYSSVYFLRKIFYYDYNY